MISSRRFMLCTIRTTLQIRKLHYITVNPSSCKFKSLQNPAILSIRNNINRHLSKDTDNTATYKEVVESVNKPRTLIIDVRNPNEVNSTGQIPSSINIPLNSVKEVLGSMSESEFKRIYQHTKPTQSDKIIFYCKSGKRATQATDIALSLGYSKSKKFLGSWDEWSSKQNN